MLQRLKLNLTEVLCGIAKGVAFRERESTTKCSALPFYTEEVMVSNLGPDTGYPEGFVVFLSLSR
jgi:hypothetical protein